jgi:hypothetical protein
MSFQLFSFRMRRFVGTMVRLNREQVVGFVLCKMSNDLADLIIAFQQNRKDWTDEQVEQAHDMLDEVESRMELEECYWDYQTSNYCTDSVGNYCLN